ncbi:MAG: nuclear transport factor 2 family protein, partial [Acidobacteriota bacterium]
MRAPVAGLLFALTFCLAPTTPWLAEDTADDASTEAVAATLLDIAERYLDAVQASDWQGMATYLADDAHYQDYSMEHFDREMIDLRGSDAIIEFWRSSG